MGALEKIYLSYKSLQEGAGSEQSVNGGQEPKVGLDSSRFQGCRWCAGCRGVVFVALCIIAFCGLVCVTALHIIARLSSWREKLLRKALQQRWLEKFQPFKLVSSSFKFEVQSKVQASMVDPIWLLTSWFHQLAINLIN